MPTSSESETKSITSSSTGKKIEIIFSPAEAEEKMKFEETEKLIAELYKTDEEGNNPIQNKFRLAYSNLNRNEEWLNQFKEQLTEKKKLLKERENVFKNGEAAFAARSGVAEAPTLEAIEGTEDHLYHQLIQESKFDENDKPTSIREWLRKKPEVNAIKNKHITRELIQTIEATKLDVATEIETVDTNLDHLLSGRILTDEDLSAIKQESKLQGSKLARLPEMMTEFLLKPQDPKKIGEIYEEIHESLNKAILANPALHPELTNPFEQRLKAGARGDENLTPFEREQLGIYSTKEDEDHKKAREKLNKELEEANKEFYRELEGHSKKQQDMIPGRLFRILLMANPFMGGILGGITLLGPLANILSGATEFNDVVLSPIKFAFNLGKLGEVGVGDAMASGLKTGIEESRILNIPNSVINIVTDNSIARSVFGSAGNAITGPMAQLGLAAAAMFFEAEKSTEFAENKDKTKTKFKEKFDKIHQGFANDLDKRRKEAIDGFCKEKATKIKENEHLAKEAGNLVADLDTPGKKGNLAKILGGKLGKKVGTAEGEIDPDKLEEFLEKNINEPAVQELLLLNRIAKKTNKVAELQAAFDSIEKYNQYLAAKKDDLTKEEKLMVLECYGLDENATDEDLAKKRKEEIEKYKEKLRPYLNYALKDPKERKSPPAEDSLSLEDGKERKSPPTEDSFLLEDGNNSKSKEINNKSTSLPSAPSPSSTHGSSASSDAANPGGENLSSATAAIATQRIQNDELSGATASVITQIKDKDDELAAATLSLEQRQSNNPNVREEELLIAATVKTTMALPPLKSETKEEIARRKGAEDFAKSLSAELPTPTDESPKGNNSVPPPITPSDIKSPGRGLG